MSRRGMLVITLITTLMLVCLIATYAWFTNVEDVSGVAQISSGVAVQIIVSDVISDGKSDGSESGSSTNDVYSGQKAYYYDEEQSKYVAYINEDKPYYFYQNVKYQAKGSQDLNVMFNLKKIEITLTRQNISVETMLKNYLKITEVSDYTNYLATYENEAYTPPVVDKGLYFITTDTSNISKDSMVSKIVLTTLSKNYFEYKFWKSYEIPEEEPFIDDNYNTYIKLIYNQDILEDGVYNYVRFKLGYYGLNTETNNYEMPFAFSDYAFMGSSYKFFIEAIGV